jgi:hypothetical protein
MREITPCQQHQKRGKHVPSLGVSTHGWSWLQSVGSEVAGGQEISAQAARDPCRVSHHLEVLWCEGRSFLQSRGLYRGCFHWLASISCKPVTQDRDKSGGKRGLIERTVGPASGPFLHYRCWWWSAADRALVCLLQMALIQLLRLTLYLSLKSFAQAGSRNAYMCLRLWTDSPGQGVSHCAAVCLQEASSVRDTIVPTQYRLLSSCRMSRTRERSGVVDWLWAANGNRWMVESGGGGVGRIQPASLAKSPSLGTL